MYTITQEDTAEDTDKKEDVVGPRRHGADDPLATIGSNRVLLSGYPYAGYLGHYNGYLNGYPYPYGHLNRAINPTKISGTISYVVPQFTIGK